MWRGERSSWRCIDNGGYRGITIVHRGITKVHRDITKVHSGEARCRRRGVVNPIHAAFIQGLGYSLIIDLGFLASIVVKMAPQKKKFVGLKLGLVW